MESEIHNINFTDISKAEYYYKQGNEVTLGKRLYKARTDRLIDYDILETDTKFFPEKKKFDDGVSLSELREEDLTSIINNSPDSSSLERYRYSLFPTYSGPESDSLKVGFFGSIVKPEYELITLYAPSLEVNDRGVKRIELYQGNEDTSSVITITFEEGDEELGTEEVRVSKVVYIYLTYDGETGESKVNISYRVWLDGDNENPKMPEYVLRRDMFNQRERPVYQGKDGLIYSAVSGSLVGTKRITTKDLPIYTTLLQSSSSWNQNKMYGLGEIVKLGTTEYESIVPQNLGNHPVLSNTWIKKGILEKLFDEQLIISGYYVNGKNISPGTITPSGRIAIPQNYSQLSDFSLTIRLWPNSGFNYSGQIYTRKLDPDSSFDPEERFVIYGDTSDDDYDYVISETTTDNYTIKITNHGIQKALDGSGMFFLFFPVNNKIRIRCSKIKPGLNPSMNEEYFSNLPADVAYDEGTDKDYSTDVTSDYIINVFAKDPETEDFVILTSDEWGEVNADGGFGVNQDYRVEIYPNPEKNVSEIDRVIRVIKSYIDPNSELGDHTEKYLDYSTYYDEENQRTVIVVEDRYDSKMQVGSSQISVYPGEPGSLPYIPYSSSRDSIDFDDNGDRPEGHSIIIPDYANPKFYNIHKTKVVYPELVFLISQETVVDVIIKNNVDYIRVSTENTTIRFNSSFILYYYLTDSSKINDYSIKVIDTTDPEAVIVGTDNKTGYEFFSYTIASVKHNIIIEINYDN